MAGLLAKIKADKLIKNPAKSESKCAASEIIAMLFARIPPSIFLNSKTKIK